MKLKATGKNYIFHRHFIFNILFWLNTVIEIVIAMKTQIQDTMHVQEPSFVSQAK